MKKAPQTIEQAFDKFDAKHPSVYKDFEKLVSSLIANNKKCISGKAIIEYLRNKDLFTNEANPAKISICNNNTSRMVRKYILNHPEHIGYFKFHHLRKE